MNQLSSRKIKVITIILSLVLIITFVLNVILPKVIAYELQALVNEYTDLSISIKKSDVDLFPLQITIDGIEVADKQQKTLISADQISVALTVTSLLTKDIVISAININKPYVFVGINKKGELALLSHIKTTEKVPANKTTEALSLLLSDVVLTNGTIDIDSKMKSLPLKKSLGISELTLHNFHTFKVDTDNLVTLNIQENAKSTIKLQGKLDVGTQKFIGKVNIQALNITPYIALAHLPLAAHINAIPTDFSSNVQLNFGEKINAKITKGNLTLHTIEVSKEPTTEKLINIANATISGISFNLQKQLIKIQSIGVNEATYFLGFDKEGKLDLLSLWQADTDINEDDNKKSNDKSKVKKAQAWQLTINNFSVNNNTITLQNLPNNNATPIVLSDIQLTAKNIKPLEKKEAFPVELNLTINQTGKISSKADVNIEPLAITGDINIKQFVLSDLQPFINAFALVQVIKGELNSQLQFVITDSTQPQITMSGDAQLPNLKINKNDSKKKLLAWDMVELKHIQFLYPKNQLSIDNIAVLNPYARIIINDNGISNLQDLLVPTDLSKPSTQTSDDTALQWAAKHIEIKEGDIGFSDQSMKPSFTTGIKNLNGTIKNISSIKDQIATVDLHGKVNRYAPVNIVGDVSLNVEKPVLDLHMDFKNLELTSFTPYSGMYAGYNIDKGQMTLDVHYQLKEKRIKGKNHIVINQLKFGKPVTSDKIINLPIKFAIALLSDENGIIDLGFDVKGNIDDPKFSINHIIFKALQETIKKAITSPFKYLKGLIGSKQKNLQSLDFIAGSDDITEETLAKLTTVAQFLESKKLLQLNIEAHADITLDKPALQESELLQILSVETKRNPQDFLLAAKPYNDKELLSVFADYYAKQRGQPYQQLLQSITEDNKQLEALDSESINKMTYEKAWEKILTTTAISNDEINKLALRRAQQVKATLIEQLHISPDRLFLLDNQRSSSQSLSTKLYIDAK